MRDDCFKRDQSGDIDLAILIRQPGNILRSTSADNHQPHGPNCRYECLHTSLVIAGATDTARFDFSRRLKQECHRRLRVRVEMKAVVERARRGSSARDVFAVVLVGSQCFTA